MSSMFWLNDDAGHVKGTLDEVRSTVTYVDPTAPAATLDGPPGWNETVTDPDTEGGLTPRQVSSHVVPSERYVPFMGDANFDHNAIVDSQVSSSGTAAAREAAGQWGHGSMKIVTGIEPVIRPGTEFSDTYFAADKPPIQDDSGDYMTPSVAADPDTLSSAASAGAAASREAAQAALWGDFYNERISG